MGIQDINNSLDDKTMKDMKTRRTPSPLGITTKMLTISSRVGYGLVIHIHNQVVREDNLLDEWCSSIIFNCYKDKGDILERNPY